MQSSVDLQGLIERSRSGSVRGLARLISRVLLVEAARRLVTKPTGITTPLQQTTVQRLGSHVVFVPVLRAGLAMLSAAEDFLPHADVGFVGRVACRRFGHSSRLCVSP